VVADGRFLERRRGRAARGIEVFSIRKARDRY
jgi:hypothetical protein